MKGQQANACECARAHGVVEVVAFPTAGLDVANETDCTGGGTRTIWQLVPGKVRMHICLHCQQWHVSNVHRLHAHFSMQKPQSRATLQGAPAHPQTWSKPEQITVHLIDRLRVPDYAKTGCNASAAISSAARTLPTAATTDSSRDSSGTFAGVGSVLDGVATHLSEALRQMPGPLQRLVGDVSAPLMRRRLQASSTQQRQHQESPLQSSWMSESDGSSSWRHPRRFGVGSRQLAQAWQGESWLLDDPFTQDDDGPDVEPLVRQYAVLGHACTLFARKVTQGAAARFAEVAKQHILSF